MRLRYRNREDRVYSTTTVGTYRDFLDINCEFEDTVERYMLQYCSEKRDYYLRERRRVILAEVVSWPPMPEDKFVCIYLDWLNGYDMENVEFFSETLSEAEYDSENDSNCEYVEFLRMTRAVHEEEYGLNTMLFETGDDPEYDRRLREFRFDPDMAQMFVFHQDMHTDRVMQKMAVLHQNPPFAIQHPEGHLSASQPIPPLSLPQSPLPSLPSPPLPPLLSPQALPPPAHKPAYTPPTAPARSLTIYCLPECHCHSV